MLPVALAVKPPCLANFQVKPFSKEKLLVLALFN
jgi:hypothetical protein